MIEMLFKCLSVMDSQQRRQFYIVLVLVFFLVILEASSLAVIYGVISMVQGLLGEPSQQVGTQWIVQFLPDLSEPNTEESAFATAKLVIFAAIGLFVLKGAIQLYLIYRKAKFIFDTQADVALKKFKSFLGKRNLDVSSANSHSDIIRACTIDATIVAGNVLQPIINSIVEFGVLVGICITLLIIEPVGFLIVAGFAGAITAVVVAATRKPLLYWGEERRLSDGFRIGILQEVSGMLREIKIYGATSWVSAKFEEPNFRAAKATRQFQIFQNVPRIVLETAIFLLILLFLYFSVSDGFSVQVNLAFVSIFALAAFRILPSVNRLTTAQQHLRYAKTTVADVLADLEIKSGQVECSLPGETLSTANDWSKISVQDFSFRYSEEQPNLMTEISLEIPRGEVVGIIGSSGSGKSTLLDLILGFKIRGTGELIVEQTGTQSSKISIGKDEKLYEIISVGLVPQSVSLISDDLESNIRLGRDRAGYSERIHTIRNQLDFKNPRIESIKDKEFDGNAFRDLSGGERQKLALIRALLASPSLLVLDEPTASLDQESEAKVIELIETVKRNFDTTIVIVTHSKTLSQICDRVYELKNQSIERH